ncbi:hypothetical protein [Sorangium cellulosum]|uniref:Uncharacterized protein n=1 Tax=Sorangium cellulosum TaxID=56 RepID=A0A150QYL5_SORCE|nr:hypothetical protein [Sorangium cellulosum]KYF73012.1 hypothetical protein BE15_47210 [Sorangium cellulosum]
MHRVHSDGTGADVLVSAVVSSTTPFCGVTPPGVGVGSKPAEIVAVDPGGCAPSGGEPLGDVVPTEPSTFCCLAQASRRAPMRLRSDRRLERQSLSTQMASPSERGSVARTLHS